jgi:hypothetical protein
MVAITDSYCDRCHHAVWSVLIMANAGLQIINAGNTTQIDQDYRNLCLRQKGNAVTTANLPAGGGSYASFNVTGLTSPIIAVGGGSAAVPQTYWDAANNRHGFLISTGGGIGASIPYYIFDVPAELGSTYGFQVRNSANQLIFDALQPPLRVRGFYVNANANVSNLTAGRTYAVAHVKLGYRAFTIETLFARLYATTVTTNGFNLQTINYSTIPASPTQTIVRLPDLMAIDVTGL